MGCQKLAYYENPVYGEKTVHAKKCANYSYFGARYYMSDVSVWLSVDPMADKYPMLSPYNYCALNPIMLTDPNGEDIYVFDDNGNFSCKIDQKGEHTGRILGKKGAKDTDFKFADPVNDPKAIEKGDITRAVVVSDKAIDETLSNSGVYDKENQDHKYDYIINESNAAKKVGAKMDYVVNGTIDINGKKEKISSGNLYVTKGKSGYTGHNDSNFGNFLWGAGAKALGFSKTTARIGAHINNFFSDGPNRTLPYYKRSFDSKDDQRSISLGVDWMKSHKK
jgi:RHS repeat-associated protein